MCPMYLNTVHSVYNSSTSSSSSSVLLSSVSLTVLPATNLLWVCSLFHCSVVGHHFLLSISESVLFLTTESASVCCAFCCSSWWYSVQSLIGSEVKYSVQSLICSEVNGLLLCVKMGKVPLECQSFSHSSSPRPNRYLIEFFYLFKIIKFLLVSYNTSTEVQGYMWASQ